MIMKLLLLVFISVWICSRALASPQLLTLHAVLPARNSSLPVALQYAADIFNSQSSYVKIQVNVTILPDEASGAGTCLAFLSQLALERPLAILDGASEVITPLAAKNISAVHINLAKGHIQSEFRRCLNTITPFFQADQWALSILGLAQTLGWERIAVVLPQGDPFLLSIHENLQKYMVNHQVHARSFFFNSETNSVDLVTLEQFGSNAIILLGSADIATKLITYICDHVGSCGYQYVWVDSDESQYGTDLLETKFMTMLSNKTEGFLGLTSTRLEASEFKLLAAATGLSEVPEEVVIAFNSVLVVAAMAENAVMHGRDPYNYQELVFNSSQIKYNNTIGSHNYLFGDRVDVINLINLVMYPTRNISQIATWSRNAGFEFQQPLSSIVWSSGPSVQLPNMDRKSVIVGVVIPTELPIFQQWRYAAEIAVEHIKEDGIVPNYDIYIRPIFSSMRGFAAAQKVGEVLENSYLSAVVGGAYYDDISALNHLLINYNIPHLAPIASAPELSDRVDFPHLIRMNAHLYQQTSALVALWKHLGWSTFSVSPSISDDGLTGADAIFRSISAYKLSPSIKQPWSVNNIESITQALRFAKESGLRVFFASGREGEFAKFLETARVNGYWSEEWAYFLSYRAELLDYAPNGTENALDGIQAIGIFQGGGPSYERLLSSFRQLDPQLHPYANISGKNESVAIGVSYVYDSLYAIAYGMKEMLSHGMTPGPSNGPALYQAINNITFDGSTGTISFTNGNRINSTVSFITRVNGTWKEFAQVRARYEDFSDANVSMLSEPTWIDGASRPRDIIPHHIEWSSAAGHVISIISLLAIAFALFAFGYVIYRRKHQLINASSPPFLLLVLSGIIIGLLPVVTATGEQNSAKCTLRVWCEFIGFVFAYGGIMIKNWRIYRLWSAETLRVVYITNLELFGYASVLLAPFVILLTFWTIFDTPQAVILPPLNNQACSYGKSLGAAIIAVIIVLIILLLGIILAVKNRNVPQLYNECRYIALSTYAYAIFTPVGIFLHIELQPVSVLASYLVYAITTIVSFGTILMAIFAPKIYLLEESLRRSKQFLAEISAEKRKAAEKARANADRESPGTTSSNPVSMDANVGSHRPGIQTVNDISVPPEQNLLFDQIAPRDPSGSMFESDDSEDDDGVRSDPAHARRMHEASQRRPLSSPGPRRKKGFL